MAQVVLTIDEVLGWIARHGIVLESGSGPVPVLADLLAGEPMRRAWWSHPEAATIRRIIREVREHRDILTCRLVGGHVTFVHRSRWPALVRLAEHFDTDRLGELRARMVEGAELAWTVPWPEWVPTEAVRAAFALTGPEARELLGAAWGSRVANRRPVRGAWR